MYGDMLTGDARRGSNDLFGWLGNDTLTGGAGNDKLRGHMGDDTHHRRRWRRLDSRRRGCRRDRRRHRRRCHGDTVSYVGAMGVTVDLSDDSNNAGGQAEGDTITNVENVRARDMTTCSPATKPRRTSWKATTATTCCTAGWRRRAVRRQGRRPARRRRGCRQADGGEGNDTASYADSNDGVTVDASRDEHGVPERTSRATADGRHPYQYREPHRLGPGRRRSPATRVSTCWTAAAGDDMLTGGAGADVLKGGSGTDTATTPAR